MSMSPPPVARASLITVANLARAPGQAIAAGSGRARRIAWLTGAAVASSLVAACGSAPASQPVAAPATTVTVTASPGAPGASPTAPVTSSPSPSSSRPPATTSPAPAASGSPGAGLAPCHTAALHMAVDDTQGQGAAGSAYYPLNFTNTSLSACVMYGYPGVSFAAAATGAGRQIGLAAQRNPAFPKASVRLGPGQTAHAWLRVAATANFPAAACQPVTARWLRVYPPGETVPGYLGRTFSVCSSSSTAQLSVLPVRAGHGIAGVTP
jgi:Protein of unknown function (DUF4232)